MDTQAIITKLMPIIQNVLGGVLSASDSGVMGKMREFGAITEFLKNAPEQFGGSDLINQLLGSLGDLDLGDLDLANFDRGAALEQIGGIDDVLSEVGDEDTGGIKGMIFALAETIASSAGGGLMGSGEKVSGDEAEFLNNLKQTLGL